MRKHILLLLLLGFACLLNGQNLTELRKGQVSYVSSQHVYVKFDSTTNIGVGDTLFFNKANALVPALVVNNKSSTSCVCIRITATDNFAVSDVFYARVPIMVKMPEVKPEPEPEEKPESIEPDKAAATAKPEKAAMQQHIKGRVYAASYSLFSDAVPSHRMQYAFTFQGDHLHNTGFSFENYITFRHTINKWDVVQADLWGALKVYSLAARYDFNPNSSVVLGRKINPNIASLGAVDGLQYEQRLGNFFVGGIAGFRPDYTNYAFNPNLLQFGAFVGHRKQDKNIGLQTTFAFLEQHNTSKVDRRYLYFQHSNTLLHNLNMFGSFEVDLFQNIDNHPKSVFDLTNFYVSLQYRATQKLRFSTAYDSRKDIIFYESYKDFIDRLIENETRQGLRFGADYRPFKLISIGANASWRFQKNQENSAQNVNAYASVSRIPWINAALYLNANYLQTGYLNSQIYGARLSRDLIPGKLNGELNYRMVDYTYIGNEYRVHQDVFGASFTLRLSKKLSLYLYYEGTFDDKSKNYQRVNTKLIQRF